MEKWHALTSRYTLSDLLCVFAVGGGFGIITRPSTPDFHGAQFWPLFYTLAAFVSGWWAASLAQTWNVKNFLARFLIHVYAFVSFFGSFLILPFLIFYAPVAGIAGIPIFAAFVSIHYVERLRSRREEARSQK